MADHRLLHVSLLHMGMVVNYVITHELVLIETYKTALLLLNIA